MIFFVILHILRSCIVLHLHQWNISNHLFNNELRIIIQMEINRS